MRKMRSESSNGSVLNRKLLMALSMHEVRMWQHFIFKIWTKRVKPVTGGELFEVHEAGIVSKRFLVGESEAKG